MNIQGVPGTGKTYNSWYGSMGMDLRTPAQKHLQDKHHILNTIKKKYHKGSKVRKAMFDRMIKKLEYEIDNHEELFAQYYI